VNWARGRLTKTPTHRSERSSRSTCPARRAAASCASGARPGVTSRCRCRPSSQRRSPPTPGPTGSRLHHCERCRHEPEHLPHRRGTMMTDPTITASLATACAAHDRHRLDVLDALLDEAAPSAVRELLGAALDLCATLHARRDEMTAQLAEVRAKLDEFRRDVSSGIAVAAQTHADEVSVLRAHVDRYDSMLTGVRNALRDAGVPDVVPYADDDAARYGSVALRDGGRALQPVERIGMLAADLASERAHFAACRTRIAGLEQAANERSRTPCNGSCDIALASRQVGPDGIVPRNARECAELWEREAARLWREETRLTTRVAELEARPVLDEARLSAALDAHGHAGLARKVFAHLGPVTLPAQDRAEELCRAYYAAIPNSSFDHFPEAQRPIRVDAMIRALASLGAPPTSPPAHPVFAGVSEDELIRLFYVVGTDGIDHGEQCPPIDSSDRNGIRAVLARLEATLVAPVDPEAVARDYQNAASDAVYEVGGELFGWDCILNSHRKPRVAAMRATLTAAGIPVTPEVCGKDTRRGDQGPPCALAKGHTGSCDGTVGK